MKFRERSLAGSNVGNLWCSRDLGSRWLSAQEMNQSGTVLVNLFPDLTAVIKRTGGNIIVENWIARVA